MTYYNKFLYYQIFYFIIFNLTSFKKSFISLSNWLKMCKHACFVWVVDFLLYVCFFCVFPSVGIAMSTIVWLISLCNTSSIVEAAHVDQISLGLSNKERVEENFLVCF